MAKFGLFGACAVVGVTSLGLGVSLFGSATLAQKSPRQALGERSLFAQQDSTSQDLPSVEHRDADVREVLREAFRAFGVSYSIAADVQGKVTVSLRNATLETILQNVLRQVDATYRVESGVYNVVRQEPGVRFDGLGPGPHQFIVNDQSAPAWGSVTSDGAYLFVVQGNRLSKVRKSDLRVVARGDLSHLTLERVDVRVALRELFGPANVRYTVAPDVRGRVTLTLPGDQTFGGLVEEVLRQVGATYRIQAGVWHISKAQRP